MNYITIKLLKKCAPYNINIGFLSLIPNKSE